MGRKRGAWLLLLLGFVLQVSAQEDVVIFSSAGGFYDDSFHLALECGYSNHHIRYTTNGNVPTADSQRYTDALWLDESLCSHSDIHKVQITPDGGMYYTERVQKCIVIRAAAFDENGLRVSATATNTYFIRSMGIDSHGLPLVSICADSLDLFDYESGIFVPGIHFDPANPEWTGNYYQKGREWEREVNVEFYELNNLGINQKAGLRAHGGNGRRYQQKNLALYAREDYGKKRFRHQFFESIPVNSFKHLQLKPFSSAWTAAGIQDAVCQTIASQSVNVESLATRPAVLFINGEYWGIYFLHEKPDERYLEDHFDVALDQCDIMGNWSVLCEYGNCDEFIEMMNGLERADLSNPVEYNRVTGFFDLDSFIDYQILELFLANYDWPSNNMRCWREGKGKWRWIFYDGDACLNPQDFDVMANATYFGDEVWPTCSEATLLLRRLLTNEDFRHRFFERFQELLNTRFQYVETRSVLAQLQEEIRDEVPSQAERFGLPNDLKTWTKECNQIDEFLRRRTTLLAQQLDDFIRSESWSFGEWLCYPNPSAEAIFLSFHTDRSENMPISIYDLTGRCVHSQYMEIHSGYNQLSLNPMLSAGVYLLSVGKKTQYIVRL
jgi:hypothetical protein